MYTVKVVTMGTTERVAYTNTVLAGALMVGSSIVTSTKRIARLYDSNTLVASWATNGTLTWIVP